MINFCKQCNKEILNNKKFCSQECYFNFLKISENNPFYGKTHNKETKNKIKLFKIGKPGLKGKLNPNYKEGKYSDNPFKCIDCGNIITDKSKLGRCASCSKKGKLNHMYDKKQSLESNIK